MNEGEPQRPLPEITAWNRAFWTGGRVGELRVQRCPACAMYLHPPSAQCPRCGSEELDYPATSGRGRVYTFSVMRHAYRAGLRVPFVLALVELAEQQGLRVTTTIVDCEPADVVIGAPVVVGFEPVGDEVFVPVFRLA